VSFATCGVAIPVILVVDLYAAFQALRGRHSEYPLVGVVVHALGVV